MADTKLYEILGVPKNASSGDIKKSYRRLAKEFHPDKNPQAGEKFKEISFAHEILTDPQKRETYDRFGLKGLQEGGGGGADIFGEDLLSHFFGGGGGGPMGGGFGGGGMGGLGGLFGFGSPFGGMGGGRVRRRQRGQDTVHPLKVSLEDMYNGKTAKLQLSKNVICVTCGGEGGKPGALHPCRSCQGRGIKVQHKMLGPGMMQEIHQHCPACNGEGESINERDKCRSCKGAKVTKETKLLEVHVDKGMKENQKITFRGEGDQEPNVEAGDVIIVLQEKAHEQFKRIENDLFMIHKLTLTEALCGFNITVKHLDGRSIVLNHPAGQVVQPGSKKGVIGEGMPIYRNPQEKGILFVQLEVDFPENHFTDENSLKILESLLPVRPQFIMPTGEHVEEVDLSDYERGGKHEHRRAGEAYESDEDGEHGHGGHGPSVQCAHQ